MRELRLSILRQRLDLIVLRRLARTGRQPELNDAIAEIQRNIDLLEEELGQLPTWRNVDLHFGNRS